MAFSKGPFSPPFSLFSRYLALLLFSLTLPSYTEVSMLSVAFPVVRYCWRPSADGNELRAELRPVATRN